jgi:hypothetical protein
MEGSGDRESAQQAHQKTGWIWVFDEVLAGKGNGGGIDALLRSRDIEGEERKGRGGLVRVAPRGGKRREGPGSAAPHGWRTAWGAWWGLAPARAHGRRRRAPVGDVRAGEERWRVWAVCEGVDQLGKGGS